VLHLPRTILAAIFVWSEVAGPRINPMCHRSLYPIRNRQYLPLK
jgi:hypothetical protein